MSAIRLAGKCDFLDERFCVNVRPCSFLTLSVGQGKREMGKGSKNASLAAGPQASPSHTDVAKLFTNRKAMEIGRAAVDKAGELRR